VPIRAKKLKRPIDPASPSASCAIRVCDPDHAKDSAPPLTICSSRSGQNHGTSGKTGARQMPIQTKNSVTRRVPNRSIKTPIWIDKKTASAERAPTIAPISAALMPSERQ
jgi:hypothetical protein